MQVYTGCIVIKHQQTQAGAGEPGLNFAQGCCDNVTELVRSTSSESLKPQHLSGRFSICIDLHEYCIIEHEPKANDTSRFDLHV
jgi:hypothetical protein